jgi:hypothetical protein
MARRNVRDPKIMERLRYEPRLQKKPGSAYKDLFLRQVELGDKLLEECKQEKRDDMKGLI